MKHAHRLILLFFFLGLVSTVQASKQTRIVEGIVLNSALMPLVGAKILVGMPEFPLTFEHEPTTTDSNGRFSVEAPIPRTGYEILVSSDDYQQVDKRLEFEGKHLTFVIVLGREHTKEESAIFQISNPIHTDTSRPTDR